MDSVEIGCSYTEGPGLCSLFMLPYLEVDSTHCTNYHECGTSKIKNSHRTV